MTTASAAGSRVGRGDRAARGHGPAHPRRGHPHRRPSARSVTWAVPSPLPTSSPRSTAASCASAPTSPTGPIATASSSPRATPPWASTAAMALAGYFDARGDVHLQQEGFTAAGSSRHEQAARHRHLDRLAGHGPLGRPGHGPRGQAPGPGLPHLRAARRRRVPGGPGLGGRPRGTAISAPTTSSPSSTTTSSSSSAGAASRLPTACRRRSRATSWRASRPSAGVSWRWTATT